MQTSTIIYTKFMKASMISQLYTGKLLKQKYKMKLVW
jgi:hypothetical protein